MGCATQRTSPGIRRRVSSGPPRSRRWAATRSTSCTPAETTVGRSCRSAKTTTRKSSTTITGIGPDGDAGVVLDAVDQPVDARLVHGRQAASLAGQSLRWCAQRPNAAARGFRSADAASGTARFAVHVVGPALASRRAGARWLSLRADGEAHARRASPIRATRRAVSSTASSLRSRAELGASNVSR